jgi:protein SCO1/2
MQGKGSVTSYPLHGIVLGISTQTGELTIRHGEIHGFMPAMTMNFKVRDAASLSRLTAGDEVRATLLTFSDSGDYQLDGIAVIGHHADAIASLPAHTLLTGEMVPDMAFQNQDGKPLRLSSYAGKTLLLTFIYSRCPLPNACPRISGNFAHIFHRLGEDPRILRKVHLLSVTLDPAYDTPEVLRSYGINFQASARPPFADWEFLRCSPQDLRRLADAFGLQYSEGNNQITHTMRTVMIGPDRRMMQTWYGSDWSPDEVAEALHRAALRE